MRRLLLNYNCSFFEKESDRIIFFEDFFEKINIETINERELKRFFRQAFEEESNGYIKTVILETICILTFMGRIPKFFTLDLLLDIDECDYCFVVTVAIKYLSIFYQDEEEIIDKIQEFKNSKDADVASEAYYRLAIIQLFNIDANSSISVFIDELYKVKKLFAMSKNLIENRADARFYEHLIEFLCLGFQEDYSKIEKLYQILLQDILVTKSYSLSENSFELEYKIFNIIKNIYNIQMNVKDVERWIRIDEELIKLSKYHRSIMSIEISNNLLYKNTIYNFKEIVENAILQPYYTKNFKTLLLRIESLENSLQHTEENELKSFLRYLMTSIKEQDSKKKEDINPAIIVKLKEIFPNKDIDCIIEDIDEINNVNKMIDLISSYIKQEYKRDAEVITGTPIGEEIFFALQKELKDYLPEYPVDNFCVFMNVLEHVISYTISTIQSNKKDYLFLYSKKAGGLGEEALEKDLQDSMYEYLMKTRLNKLALDYEKKDFADGGRVDIVYSDKKMTIPIELKKTNEEITDENIRSKYLSQIQTYTYSYNQLGIFVLLDLKGKQHPVNDIRSLFKIEHLEPVYDIKDKYPNYIVRVIIPGNKLLPSQKSTYK